MRIGFHIPFSGNIDKLKEKIHISRGNTFQIFARSLRGVDKDGNPHMLHKLNEKKINEFHLFLNEKNIQPFFVHAPYFYNLAQEKNYNRKMEEVDHKKLIMEDLEWSKKIGANYYILQPGYYKKEHPIIALENIKDALSKILDKVDWEGEILIKNMAGAGTEIGSTLEEWNELISFHPKVKGILDFSRLFSSGTSFITENEAEKFYIEIEDKVNWEKIKALYINDSDRGCGSQKNNYVPLGEGVIGFYGYEYILKHGIIQQKPWLVENQPKPTYYDISIENLLTIAKGERE